MKSVFVFEYLSGGGLIDGDADGKSAAELMPMGCLMRDAVVGDLLALQDRQVTVAGCEHAPVPPAGARTTQAQPGESVFDFVARLSAVHDAAWIVAPETSGLLARFCRRTEAARWLGCDHAATVLAASKQATLRRVADVGLRTPLSFEHDAETRRWVVKPDDGAGAVDSRVHASRDAADHDLAARTGPHATLEPWVEGEPLSLSLHCSAAGTELLSVNRQQIDIAPDGSLAFQGVVLRACDVGSRRGSTAQMLARQLAQAIPGLRGFVGIDLVWHAVHGPVVIEVNPRVTCAYPGLSAALGRNLAGELLAAHEREHTHACT